LVLFRNALLIAVATLVDVEALAVSTGLGAGGGDGCDLPISVIPRIGSRLHQLRSRLLHQRLRTHETRHVWLRPLRQS
jgi:hypothetical protein